MTPSSEATPRPWNILTIASSAGASSRIFSEVTNSDICHIPMEWNGRTNGADAALIVAAVNSYDESRKLLEDVQKALDEVAGLDFEAGDCAHYKQLSARITAHLEA